LIVSIPIVPDFVLLCEIFTLIHY